jgi:hypothetical protein
MKKLSFQSRSTYERRAFDDLSRPPMVSEGEPLPNVPSREQPRADVRPFGRRPATKTASRVW